MIISIKDEYFSFHLNVHNSGSIYMYILYLKKLITIMSVDLLKTDLYYFLLDLINNYKQ